MQRATPVRCIALFPSSHRGPLLPPLPPGEGWGEGRQTPSVPFVLLLDPPVHLVPPVHSVHSAVCDTLSYEAHRP